MIEPLLRLVEIFELETKNVGYPNEVQTSPREYGYCPAIIVLAVVVFESALNLIRHSSKEKEEDKPNRAIDYFRSLSAEPSINAKVAELFVIRDAIVHNHVWDGSIIDDQDGLHYIEGPRLTSGYGDKKHKKHVNEESHQTKELGLNVVPTKIWRRDVVEVFSVIDEALIFLESIDRGYFGADKQIFIFHGEYVSFHTAVARIKKTGLIPVR